MKGAARHSQRVSGGGVSGCETGGVSGFAPCETAKCPVSHLRNVRNAKCPISNFRNMRNATCPVSHLVLHLGQIRICPRWVSTALPAEMQGWAAATIAAAALVVAGRSGEQHHVTFHNGLLPIQRAPTTTWALLTYTTGPDSRARCMYLLL